MTQGASSRMPALAAWIVVICGGLALAAGLAPVVYAGLVALSPELRWPYARVFNRVAMLAAVVLLVLVRRSVGWEDLLALSRGRTPGAGAREVGMGFLCALAAAAVGVTWAWASVEIGAPLATPPRLVSRVASFFVGGLVAGVLEEAFFRGMLFSRLSREIGWRAAVLVSSGIYSLVHLLASDPTVRWSGYSPGFGFDYLGHAVGRQAEPAALPVLFGLFLLGVVLALVVRRTGSLYPAIGLHAGWALSFQLAVHTTRPLIEVPGAGLVAWRHFLAGRPWAWAAMALSGLLVLAWAGLWRRRDRVDGALPAS